MRTVLHYVAVFLLANGLYQLFKYYRIRSMLNRVPGPTNVNDQHRICVLAPVLREEKNIGHFTSRLMAQDYPRDKYEIYIVTTQKEYLYTKEGNTVEKVRVIAASGSWINHIHYPFTEGHKSDQLNYAFNQLIREKGEQWVNETYFLFLDADSDIDKNLLSRFNDAITDGIEIYQQPLSWFKNFDQLQSGVMKSFAFLQTFFSVSYEIPMFLGMFYPHRLKFLVGHGLFVKGSFLIQIGGLPGVIEDVRLGRMASFLGKKVKLVKGFGNVETAKNYPIYIKQSGVWFFGTGLFLKDYLHSLHFKKFQIRDLALIAYGFYKATRWLNKGLFHLIGLVFGLLTNDVGLVFLFFISLLVNSSLQVLVVAPDFKSYWGPKYSRALYANTLAQAVFYAPVLYMLNFVGVYDGLFKLLKYFLWGQYILVKTER